MILEVVTGWETGQPSFDKRWIYRPLSIIFQKKVLFCENELAEILGFEKVPIGFKQESKTWTSSLISWVW